ncbi:ABC transporter permease [Micromonospora sp. NPDC049679]|uniref:ABC transporter permease n=1 Tax=Micromonospora sp. NPDC049679 TaxID=3155920 RepID=UPI0033DAF98D
MNLVRSELLKIRTTSTWWVFALITLPLWALALFFNYLQADALLHPERLGEVPPEQAEQLAAAADVKNIAANLYTTGQFSSLLIVMLLGIIVVTSEFFHQTATTTFITSPRRTAVILAKFVAACVLGLFFWAIITAINIPVGMLILRGQDVDPQLGTPGVWQAIALNGLAYLLWAIIGVGFGVLIRSQIGATVAAIVVYFAGYIGAIIFFSTLANRFGDWINNVQLFVPPLASQLMVSGTDLPGNPPRWAGAAVLIGYAAVTGIIGTLITRRRDIS